ncbi:MAG: hypothetical protein RL095_3694 [Verrucomicrobiota bacterium]|jgi:hypothetical protein
MADDLSDLEQKAGMQLPTFAVVTAIPDPPAQGGQCLQERPKYAVNLRLLRADLTVDPTMPELKEVPVALPGAGQVRGFSGLPRPGTIVEVAWAYGLQTLPFVRSVLPYGLELTPTGSTSMRWQHSAECYQEASEAGDWKRVSPGTIADQCLHQVLQAAADFQAKAPKVWVGSEAENVLGLVSEFMAATITALNVLSTHTHPSVAAMTSSQGTQVSGQATAITAVKARLDGVKM